MIYHIDVRLRCFLDHKRLSAQIDHVVVLDVDQHHLVAASRASVVKDKLDCADRCVDGVERKTATERWTTSLQFIFKIYVLLLLLFCKKKRE